jgi:hypothetical protein
VALAIDFLFVLGTMTAGWFGLVSMLGLQYSRASRRSWRRRFFFAVSGFIFGLLGFPSALVIVAGRAESRWTSLVLATVTTALVAVYATWMTMLGPRIWAKIGSNAVKRARQAKQRGPLHPFVERWVEDPTRDWPWWAKRLAETEDEVGRAT